MKSRWQQYSHKVLRWNRMDKDTKSDTTKQSLDETDKGAEDKPAIKIPKQQAATPSSPSQSEPPSHVIPQVCEIAGSSIKGSHICFEVS